MTEKDDSPEKTSKNEEKIVTAGRGLSTWAIIFLLIINIAVSAASIYVYDRYFAQKVAVLDVRGYVQERKNLFIAGKISEQEFTSSVGRIEAALRRVDNRTVVISGDAVVRSENKIQIDD